MATRKRSSGGSSTGGGNRAADVGRPSTPIYGMEAGAYERPMNWTGRPVPVKFTAGYFKKAPFVVTSVVGTYIPGLNECILDLDEKGFNGVSANSGPPPYTVHWIAFGEIGSQFVDTSANNRADSTPDRKSRKKK